MGNIDSDINFHLMSESILSLIAVLNPEKLICFQSIY
jgi:hypothetical protein